VYPFDENGPALAIYSMLRGMLEIYSGSFSDIEIELLVGVDDLKCLNVRRHPLLNIPMTPVLRTLRSGNGVRTTLSNLSKISNKIENSDIIFYNSPPTDMITSTYPYIARLKRKKQMYYLHGALITERVNSTDRKYFHLIASLGFIDKVIIPLKSFANEVSKLICPRENILTIPECVFTPWYEEPSKISLQGDPVVLYAGRLAQVKRVDVLLQAFSTVVSQYPSARLYLAGSGPLESYLKKHCIKLRLSDKVFFLGHVRHEELRVLYRSCDIFAIPSDSEFMSLSLLEAMASKCAVIASDIAAVEVIRNGQNGLIFSRGDSNALAEDVSLLADDRALRKKLANEANLTVKKDFDYRVVASKLIEEMHNMLISQARS
jgi:glycosyltransferase involved in cell wall biosynthesis